jgi:hypothetical protein
MTSGKPTVVVTGVSGNLGLRLLPQLGDFSVIGIDVAAPKTDLPIRFVRMDLGLEESCRALYNLFREAKPFSVVHLAFVLDQQRSGVLDVDRMWHINVAGTARVMEAITEANRNEDSGIRQFIFPSSVAVYGPDLPGPVTEDFAFDAHTLPYAIHKRESDEVVRLRAPALRGCSVYILRPHIFAGATVENYMIGAFRGTPNGKGKRAGQMRKEGKRLPCMLPYGQRFLDHQIQFVGVDAAFVTAAQERLEKPVVERIPSLFPVLDNRLGAIRQARDFLGEQLIPKLPAELAGKLRGNFTAAAAILAFNGNDFDHLDPRGRKPFRRFAPEYFIAQSIGLTPPPPGSFFFRTKAKKNITAAPTHRTLNVSM